MRPENAASRGVLARVGFVVVGTDGHGEEVWERMAPPPARTALLRRQLVDHGLLQRTASGSQYARVSAPVSPS